MKLINPHTMHQNLSLLQGIGDRKRESNEKKLVSEFGQEAIALMSGAKDPKELKAKHAEFVERWKGRGLPAQAQAFWFGKVMDFQKGMQEQNRQKEQTKYNRSRDAVTDKNTLFNQGIATQTNARGDKLADNTINNTLFNQGMAKKADGRAAASHKAQMGAYGNQQEAYKQTQAVKKALADIYSIKQDGQDPTEYIKGLNPLIRRAVGNALLSQKQAGEDRNLKNRKIESEISKNGAKKPTTIPNQQKIFEEVLKESLPPGVQMDEMGTLIDGKGNVVPQETVRELTASAKEKTSKVIGRVQSGEDVYSAIQNTNKQDAQEFKDNVIYSLESYKKIQDPKQRAKFMDGINAKDPKLGKAMLEMVKASAGADIPKPEPTKQPVKEDLEPIGEIKGVPVARSKTRGFMVQTQEGWRQANQQEIQAIQNLARQNKLGQGRGYQTKYPGAQSGVEAYGQGVLNPKRPNLSGRR